MFKWFSRLREWLFGEPETFQPSVVQAQEPQPEPLAIDTQETGLGNAHSIHDILDNLPGYFADLKALRSFDEDAYAICATLGGCMTTDRTLFSTKVDKDVLKNPPAIRCHFMPKGGQESIAEDRMSPAIFFMMRLHGGQICVDREGCVVHLPEGLCYSVTEVFNPPSQKHPVAFRFFVHIDDEGRVKVLRETRTTMQTLPAAYSSYSGRVTRNSFPRLATQVPRWVAVSAKEKGMSPDEWVQMIVPIALSAARPNDAILVRAIKGSMTASWTIDKRDAKRFFAKRETGLADDGRRKRVLHFVGEFSRRVGENIQNVRAHYRGERSFMWQGHKIEISGLGFHHADFFNSHLAGLEDPYLIGNRKVMSMERVADEMREYYTREFYLSRKAA